MKKIKDKIRNKQSKVGIIGLGYVGLELLLSINEKKFTTFGFDKDKFKIEKLKKNLPTISTITKQRLSKTKKKFFYNLKYVSKINLCDVIIICVPTPIKKNLEPDMSYVKNSIKSIYNYLRPGQILILESTVYPGATREILFNTIRKNKKLKIGKNFFICFSPERVSPGKDYSINYSDITKVISGYSKNCVKILSFFYSTIFKKIYVASSLESAEFTKLFENCYRSVNIGLVNQMKIICDKLGLKIFDIIQTASTKPFGFRPFAPGPGVGGHCIPIDPLFISWVAGQKKVSSDFIKISRDVNLNITKWVVDKIIKKLNKNQSKILIVGMAYKRDVDDYRESPSIEIFSKLKRKKFSIDYFDPYISKLNIKNKTYHSLTKINSIKLKSYNAIIIATDHRNINYKSILKNSKIIFDTRGVFQNINDPKVVHC